MPSKHGLTASLVCNGTVSTEYPSTPSTPLTVYCESKPGDTFVVKMTGKQPRHDICAGLYVDGVRVEGVACRKNGKKDIKIVFRGIYPSSDPLKIRPYQFTNIKLSDEDVKEQDEQVIKNLGTVTLKLHKCVYGEKQARSIESVPKNLAADQEFSEQNKKASMIPHTVGLGEMVLTSHKQSPHYYPRISKEKHPYVEFTWHYRSRNILVAKEIIPRPIVASLASSQHLMTNGASSSSNIQATVASPSALTTNALDVTSDVHKHLNATDIKPLLNSNQTVKTDPNLITSSDTFAGNSRCNPFVIDNDEEDIKPFLPDTDFKRVVRTSEPSSDQSSSSKQAVHRRMSDEKPDTKSLGSGRASKRFKRSAV